MEASRIDHESLKSELKDFAGLNLLKEWWQSNCEDDNDDDDDEDDDDGSKVRVLGVSKWVRSCLTFPLREVPADSKELNHFLTEFRSEMSDER